MGLQNPDHFAQQSIRSRVIPGPDALLELEIRRGNQRLGPLLYVFANQLRVMLDGKLVQDIDTLMQRPAQHNGDRILLGGLLLQMLPLRNRQDDRP